MSEVLVPAPLFLQETDEFIKRHFQKYSQYISVLASNSKLTILTKLEISGSEG